MDIDGIKSNKAIQLNNCITITEKFRYKTSPFIKEKQSINGEVSRFCTASQLFIRVAFDVGY